MRRTATVSVLQWTTCISTHGAKAIVKKRIPITCAFAVQPQP